jgi:hypothetical protein
VSRGAGAGHNHLRFFRPLSRFATPMPSPASSGDIRRLAGGSPLQIHRLLRHAAGGFRSGCPPQDVSSGRADCVSSEIHAPGRPQRARFGVAAATSRTRVGSFAPVPVHPRDLRPGYASSRRLRMHSVARLRSPPALSSSAVGRSHPRCSHHRHLRPYARASLRRRPSVYRFLPLAI